MENGALFRAFELENQSLPGDARDTPSEPPREPSYLTRWPNSGAVAPGGFDIGPKGTHAQSGTNSLRTVILLYFLA
jgi:hypothetical protein